MHWGDDPPSGHHGAKASLSASRIRLRDSFLF